MNPTIRSVHVVACAIFLLPVYGLASEAPTVAIPEIVVTAQKREQNLQDVPISVSAFDSTFLNEAGVDDVLELQFFVPGLTVYNNQSTAQTNFNIRGVGTAGNSLSLESSVGIYVDGVYRARQSSAISDLVDLERVEVLRGPQGTLFGKNTASGAVQFITVAPRLDISEGYIEANAGDLGYLNLNGAVNVPLVEGRAVARLSAGWTERDGYADNLTTGNELNERDRYTLRGQLSLFPADDISIRIIADYSEIDERCCSAANLFDGPGDTVAAFAAAGGIPFVSGPPGASYRQSIEGLGGQTVLAQQFDRYNTAMNMDPFAEIEESGLSVEVNWDVGNVTITSLTGYRRYEATNFIDADFSSLDSIRTSGNNADQDTFTQEFRIAGDVGSRLTYVAGIYYFDQQLDDTTTLRLGADANNILTGGATLAALDAAGAFAPNIPAGAVCAGLVNPALVPLCALPAFPAGEGSDNISEQEQRSWAVFAQAEFDLSEQLFVTLGIRYSDEDKDMNVRFTETIPTPAFAAFTPLSPLVADVRNISLDEEEITGTAKLTWQWTDTMMAYASYGRGFKSGGTNIDRISPSTGAPLLFKPEIAESVEFGIKASFAESRVNVNAAIYRTNFDDFQENTFVGTGFVLQNAGEIQTQGAEIEVQARPLDWLSLLAGAAYVDAEYDSFDAGLCTLTPLTNSPDAGNATFPDVCNNTGNVVPGTPELTFFGSIQVERALTNQGSAYGRLDFNWRDDTISGNDNDRNKTQDAFSLLNLRLGYRFGEGRYDVSLWGKNILDEDYHGGAFNSVIREGSLTAYHTEPATWGVTFRLGY